MIGLLTGEGCKNREGKKPIGKKEDLFKEKQRIVQTSSEVEDVPFADIFQVYENSDLVVTCVPLKIDSVVNKSNKAIFFLVGTRVVNVLKGKQKPQEILYYISNTKPQFKLKDTVAAYLIALRNKKLLAYNFNWQWNANAPYLNQYAELGNPKTGKRNRLAKRRKRKVRELAYIEPIRIDPHIDTTKFNTIINFSITQ
ncbi:hypothetical protein [Pedobacter sp. MW01-1-1]|uniref:hypothetical protein n=1 Tax=Pedobacter sp. MW01-1-1 TaxID=3383027 RepID=UPI003FEE8AE4